MMLSRSRASKLYQEIRALHLKYNVLTLNCVKLVSTILKFLYLANEVHVYTITD